MASNQVTGIVKIDIDGKLLRSKPGAKLKVGGKKRDAVVGHEVYGFVEEPVAAELDCTIAHMSSDDAVDMSKKTGATVRFECDTGQVYNIRNAWVSEPCEVAAGGDMSLKMMGPPAEKE